MILGLSCVYVLITTSVRFFRFSHDDNNGMTDRQSEISLWTKSDHVSYAHIKMPLSDLCDLIKSTFSRAQRQSTSSCFDWIQNCKVCSKKSSVKKTRIWNVRSCYFVELVVLSLSVPVCALHLFLFKFSAHSDWPESVWADIVSAVFIQLSRSAPPYLGQARSLALRLPSELPRELNSTFLFPFT